MKFQKTINKPTCIQQYKIHKVCNFDKNDMNYISKVFSPRVNITQLDEEEVADTIPPTNFENSTMEQGDSNQAFTRSQGSTGMDLNNIGDPSTGVRNRKRLDTENLKSSTVNFVIYIPNGRNTTLQDAPHIKSTMKTPQGKDCYTVYINYLQDALCTYCVKKHLRYMQ